MQLCSRGSSVMIMISGWRLHISPHQTHFPKSTLSFSERVSVELDELMMMMSFGLLPRFISVSRLSLSTGIVTDGKDVGGMFIFSFLFT